MRKIGLAFAAVWIAGCGLTLDLQPDPDASTSTMDAGVGTLDASAADTGMVDPPDAGPDPSDAGEDSCSDDSDCESGDRCGGGSESCVGGRCIPNEVRVGCDDAVPCTVDTCDPVSGCVHRPDHGLCPPTVGTDCRDSLCDPVAGCVLRPRPGACGDDLACTADSCRIDDGLCDHTPIDGRCRAAVGPGSTCDTSDSGLAPSGCTEIECSPSSPCPDADAECVERIDCVDGACVVVSQPDGTTCDDELGCTLTTVCQAGLCNPTSRADCDDSNPCTQDYCVENAGTPECMNSGAPNNGMACDPGVPCATGACDGGSCEVDFLTCVDNPASCLVQTCNTSGSGGAFSCVPSSPCELERRVCDGTGGCGQCEPGYLDCTGDRFCECAQADGCFSCSGPDRDAGATVFLDAAAANP